MQSERAPRALREEFERALALAAQAHRSGEGGHEVAALHASEVDRLLARLFEGSLREMGSDGKGCALIALGGYGRGELAPYSDLDLLLVHRGWREAEIAQLNKLVFYPLWDAGRDLGNRVRELKELARVPDRTDEAAALLDLRHVAGDRALFADAESTVVSWFQRARTRLFRRLHAQNLIRHAAHGHAGHLLEPDVRDSAGGLRDIHSLGWGARLLTGHGALSGLVETGHLSPRDRAHLAAAAEFLLRVRIELHIASGRRQDRLYLPDQDQIADRLRYTEAPGLAAGDSLMRDLYDHARTTAEIVQSVWEGLTRRAPRFRRSHVRSLGDGCVIRDGRVEVVAVPAPEQDPAGWLGAFVHSIRERLPIARPSLNQLEAACAGLEEVAWTPAARSAFEDLLRSGGAGTRALEALDSSRLLPVLLPEWAPIRRCPQRNLYHRYSVDVHAFNAVAELVASRRSSEPDVADAWSRVGDDEVLLLATLLHDVGKGRGGDHVALGEKLAARACERIGLGAGEVSEVAFLVREHLTLAETATRRDLNDERTAAEVAARIGEGRKLAMLFLLTRADAIATGPEAWSPFRSALIRELYAKTLRLLERGATADDAEGRARRAQIAELLGAGGVPEDESLRLIAAMPPGWLDSVPPDSAARQLLLLRTTARGAEAKTAVHEGERGDELIVITGDRPGLFATVSGVLAYRGVNVLSADIFTRADGAAIEVFRVTGAHGPIPHDRWDSITEDVSAALTGRLDVEKVLRAKASGARARRSRGPASHVLVSNAVSDFYTVVEVHAADRLGLLHTITRALADAGCDVHLAKVATYGIEVVDVFYVRDLEGQRIEDPEQIRRVERMVLEALR